MCRAPFACTNNCPLVTVLQGSLSSVLNVTNEDVVNDAFSNVVTGIVLILSYLYMLLIFVPFHTSLVKTFGLWVGNLMIIFPINFLFLRGTTTALLLELFFHIATMISVLLTNLLLLHSTEATFEQAHKKQKETFLYAILVSFFLVVSAYFSENYHVLLASFHASCCLMGIGLCFYGRYRMRKEYNREKFYESLILHAFLVPSLYYFFIVLIVVPVEKIEIFQFLLVYYSYQWLPMGFSIISLLFLCVHKRKKISFQQILATFWTPEVKEKPETLYI